MRAKERHELKSDQFAETMMALGAFLNKYRRHAAVIAIILIACTLGVLWYLHNKSAKLIDYWTRVSGVEISLASVSPEVRTKEALDKAIGVYQAVVDQANATPAGIYAMLKTGDLQFEKKDYAAAANTYRHVLNDPLVPEVYKKFAADSLGPALEQAGKWDEALAFYKVQSAGKEGEEAARLRYAMSRCYERFGNAEEAAKAREETIKLAPQSQWAEMAKVDAALAAQAPAPKTETAPASKTNPLEQLLPVTGLGTPGTPAEMPKASEAPKAVEPAKPAPADKAASAEKSAPVEKTAPAGNAPAAPAK